MCARTLACGSQRPICLSSISHIHTGQPVGSGYRDGLDAADAALADTWLPLAGFQALLYACELSGSILPP